MTCGTKDALVIPTLARAKIVGGVSRIRDVAARLLDKRRGTGLDSLGDEIELVVSGGERTLTVDGERGFGSVPALEQIGERLGPAYVVRARKLEDRIWEVEASAL